MWNEVAAEIHNTCKAKGFWPANRNIGEAIGLMHSELSEAHEARTLKLMDDKLTHRLGFEVEIADALIRALDMSNFYGFDLNHNVGIGFVTMNEVHNFPVDDLLTGHYILSIALEQHRKGKEPTALYQFISWILTLANSYDLDIETIVREKMDYNAQRPFLHGKAY